MRCIPFRLWVLICCAFWGLWPLAALAKPRGAPSLTLKEALRLAWKANPTLQISRLQALIAGEEVVRARSGLSAPGQDRGEPDHL